MFVEKTGVIEHLFITSLFSKYLCVRGTSLNGRFIVGLFSAKGSTLICNF